MIMLLYLEKVLQIKNMLVKYEGYLMKKIKDVLQNMKAKKRRDENKIEMEK